MRPFLPKSTRNIFLFRSFFRHHSADGSGQATKMAPLSASANIGLFGNFLLRSPNGFELLMRAVDAKANELVKEIVQSADERAADRGKMKSTVSLVDDLSNEICSAADLTDCVRCMHTDPKWGKAAENAMRFFTSLVETLNTMPLDMVSERTAKLLLEEFEHSGIKLSSVERQQFVQLSDEIFDAGTNFVVGCERPVKLNDEERSTFGLSDSHLDGPWTQHADRRLRWFTYTKYFEHNDQQESFLRRLVSARHDLALLTNFQSFAHRAQNNSVLGTYENVHSFLTNIIERFLPKCDVELAEVQQFVQKFSLNFDTVETQLNDCDVEFATTLKRQSILQTSGHPSHSSFFFHLASLLDGFEWLVGALYKLRFERCEPAEGECWPGNVVKLNVHHLEDGAFLGSIFLDIDARPSKIQGDCHFTIRCSKLLDDGVFQTPIVVLSLAIVPDAAIDSQKSSLAVFERATMNVQQAENFFHEMGHAMHSILGRTRFQHVAGTRCPTDFAEVPSHLMECFFSDTRILRRLWRDKSGRAPTDESAEILDGIAKSRRVFNALHTTRQAFYALFDLELYGERAAEIAEGRMSTTELFGHLQRKALPGLKYSDNSAYHHRIAHSFTYGAKYYSYLVARAGASLIYERLFAEDPTSGQNGLKWAKVQSYGGEYPSDVLLAMALNTLDGKAPTATELVSALDNQSSDAF
uniref:Peptidase M3A/M3B catalytic domain-containing protein n=1 Tax=Globodera rostochiensis TaxID=31243 RepID=A0A914HYA8_GLORO